MDTGRTWEGRALTALAEQLQAAPTAEELLAAARWTTSHDPSAGFRGQLLLALAKLGVDDAAFE